MPVRRSYLNVYQDGRKRLEQNTTVNNFNGPGTVKGLLDIMSVEMEKLYDALEYVYRSIDPTRAAGADLDKIGYLVGESRTSSVTAGDSTNTNFRFYIDPRLNWNLNTMVNRNYVVEERNTLESAGFITRSGGTVTSLIIPQGTIVRSSDGGITYTTIEDAIMGDTGEVFVGIIASSSGPDYNVDTNALVSHRLIDYPELRKLGNFIKCTNRFPIQNGKYTLTDEEFRYNISTSRSAIRTNELSIRRAALSVPGVRDILFEKNKYGNGTVNIIIDGVSPLISEGLIKSVKEKIQQELSYGDVIFVNRPTYLGVELGFNIVTEPGATNEDYLRNEARSAAIQYINDIPIGGEIIWNQLVSTILDIDGIQDVIPNLFKIGEYNIFYKINQKQIVLRFINQKATFNQKFYTDTGLITCCS